MTQDITQYVNYYEIYQKQINQSRNIFFFLETTSDTDRSFGCFYVNILGVLIIINLKRNISLFYPLTGINSETFIICLKQNFNT